MTWLRRCSGARWAYRIVMASAACPRISFSASRLPPRIMNQLAKWWRQSWKWKSSSLASVSAFSNAVRKSPAGHTRPSRGPGRLRQDVVDDLTHGYLAAAAGFRHLEPDDAAAQVDPVPRQPEEFTAAEARLQSDRHDGSTRPVL